MLLLPLLITTTALAAAQPPAEAPPGWVRDASGRVMQFNFDLNRRIYLGGAWAPMWPYGGDRRLNRYRAEFGFEVEFPDDDDDTLHRWTFAEGEFFFGQNTGLLTGVRYDWNHASKRPVARITTFVSRPSRFDLTMNLGGYLSALRWNVIRREGVDESELMLGTAQPTFDLWHSADLVSWVRLRAGPALVLDTERENFGLMGQAALEADTTLDRRGFHHARLIAEAERVWLLPEVAGRAGDPSRLRLVAEYELIILAINDQPLSLVIDGRGAWRDDLPEVAPRWEWGTGLGLRFSLWAPARRNVKETL